MTIVWFDADFRLADHPALFVAARRGAVLPVYLHVPAEYGAWAPGAARRWWLHHSLSALDTHLRLHGSRLTIRAGESSLDLLVRLVKETGAHAVYWNRRYEPLLGARDHKIARTLGQLGIETEQFEASLLSPPDRLLTQAGTPYTVFTPFWRRFMETADLAPPLPVPDALVAPPSWPDSQGLDGLSLLAGTPGADGYPDTWTPGLAGAEDRLERLRSAGFAGYEADRDYPGVSGVSRLSPHIRHGELSVRQVWYAAEDAQVPEDREAFRRQLAWRDFSYYILHHHPDTPSEPLKPGFEAFRWQENPGQLHRWQRGETGYPIVDAGMRQLAQTGWMHNRVRMIVASFLTKHLRLHWAEGAAWFWDGLVDADLANNTMGWQWVAGCGADAQPYFRIFNPMLQGEKFDPEGVYVRRWLPELARLPVKFIHSPWTAPPAVLREAGVELGATYPRPVVDHKAARRDALDAYRRMRDEALQH